MATRFTHTGKRYGNTGPRQKTEAKNTVQRRLEGGTADAEVRKIQK